MTYSDYHNQTLKILKHNWIVKSVDQHTNGFWEMDTKSFDLRDLKIKNSCDENQCNQLYLEFSDEKVLIKIGEDESFYEVNKLEQEEIIITCFFQSKNWTTERTKLMTLTLRR